MDGFIEIINSSLEKINSKMSEFQRSQNSTENCQRRKKRKMGHEPISNFADSSSSSKDTPKNIQEQSYGKQRGTQPPSLGLDLRDENECCDGECTKSGSVEETRSHSLLALLEGGHLSSWEAQILTRVAEGFHLKSTNREDLIRSNSFLHSIWQRLHTGHWSEVPLDLRMAYSWGSIALVGLLLRSLLADLEKGGSESLERVRTSALRVVQACDRGLLMGGPLERNPLHAVASLLNGAAMGPIHSNRISPLLSPPDGVPEEVVPFSSVVALETRHLPSLQEFLLSYKERGRPLKILGIADAWPALSKWDFSYLRKVAGARTVPVEVGSRYSDPDWSQTLMTMDCYLAHLMGDTTGKEDQKTMYLAQHQLLDQIPELLSDIVVPDYCHTGERYPVVNAWIGPGGTVTPLHYDPDHNILVQIYGYKNILIFDETNSELLYAFDDPLLSNTSKLNLEDEVKKKDLFNTWPLLKEVSGYYLTLGPGDSLYLPPKWWHYVRSLSNSISLSFWWR